MEEAESVLAQEYIDRIARLRKQRGFTQQEMARALGVPLERYKKYERRTPLPIHLIERFAAIVGRSVNFVVAGRSEPSSRNQGPFNS